MVLQDTVTNVYYSQRGLSKKLCFKDSGSGAGMTKFRFRG